MKLVPHVPRVSIAPRWRKRLRRSTVLVGGIAVMCGLLYLAAWIFTGDQRLALRFAGFLFCGLLAVVVGILLLTYSFPE